MADGLDLTPNRIVEVPAPRGTVRIGQSLPVAFIAGPCQLESRAHGLEMSARLREIADRLGCHMIYKTSFDKANRSSINTARGLGLSASLDIFNEIRETSGLPVITDVHLPDQCAEVAQAVDVLQIPAFLSRQTDLLVAAAQTGKPINVKKGQFLAPADMRGILGKLAPGRAILTERGTSFGYGDLVVDLRALPTMRALGAPVCFDATHSVQKPGAGATAADGGPTTGGDRRFAAGLARAAAAMGVDMIFAEVHDAPEEALSDGPNQLPLAELERSGNYVTAPKLKL